MLRLRSTAAAMQRHILHPLPVLTDDVLVNGVYEPVHEDRLVRDDIYDVVTSPWGTRVPSRPQQVRSFQQRPFEASGTRISSGRLHQAAAGGAGWPERRTPGSRARSVYRSA